MLCAVANFFSAKSITRRRDTVQIVPNGKERLADLGNTNAEKFVLGSLIITAGIV